MKKALLTLLVAAMLMVGVSTTSAAAYTYTAGDRLNSGEQLSGDGWLGDDLANWIIGNGAGAVEYIRNNNGGDGTITRQNDGDFSYTIDAATTSFTLEVTGRMGAGFFQLGLIDSSGSQLVGMGADYNNTNNCFIIEGSRFYESGTSYTGDAVHTMRMEVDLLANGGNGSADLFYDNNLIIDDQALTLPDLTTATGLFLRNNTQYNGPESFTITTVPEPATMSLLALGGMAMLRRRKK